MSLSCSDISFTESVYDMGYIPLYTDIIRSGLVAIKATDNLPDGIPVLLTIASDCVLFPNEDGSYGRSSYTLAITKGKTVYIPFKVNSGACGATDCSITYSWDIDLKTTCTGSATIHWYVATCDFQKCLLESTEILCQADFDCEADICKDAALQNMIKLTMIDQVLEQEIGKAQMTEPGLQKKGDVSFSGADRLFAPRYISERNEYWVIDGTPTAECIRRVDADTLAELSSIALPSGSNPVDILYLPEYGKAYVSIGNPGDIKIIDVAALVISGTITHTGSYKLGRYMCRYRDASNDKCFIVGFNTPNGNVGMIDIATDTLTSTLVIPSFFAWAPIVVSDINEIWVTGGNSEKIARIDPSDNSLIAQFTPNPGKNCQDICYVPGTINRVFVSSNGDTATIVKTSDLSVTAQSYPSGFFAPTYNSNSNTIFYTEDSSTSPIYEINADNLSPVNTYTAANAVWQMQYDSNTGTLISATDYPGNTLSVFTPNQTVISTANPSVINSLYDAAFKICKCQPQSPCTNC